MKTQEDMMRRFLRRYSEFLLIGSFTAIAIGCAVGRYQLIELGMLVPYILFICWMFNVSHRIGSRR